MITGFWHGAEWNFVIWGLYFGLLLMLEKLFLGKVLEKLGAFVQHVYVIFTVLISFVIFSVESMDKLPVFVGGLFGAGGIPLFDERTLYVFDSFLVLLVICIVASMPLPKKLFDRFSETKTGAAVLTFAEPVIIVLLLLTSTALLVDGSFNPFLYFRF